jgi:mitochondrial fission protein ELM1
MPDLTPFPTCWIVTEGLAGTENQCIGIAESLDIPFEIKRVRLSFPWNLFSPYLGFECAGTFAPRLTPPWPDLLIASGRKSIAAARYIKAQSGGKTFTVQVQDPRISPDQFDLVAVPAHDGLRGENIIVTTGAPNRITPEKLAGARQEFEHFQDIPAPRIAVLIGGSSKTYAMSAQITADLAAQLRNLQESGQAGLMVTASRRTGAENRTILEEALSGSGAYIWDGSGENPYFGMLGWADIIMVTADSSSMLSEAATTGKPVYMIALDGGSAKFSRLHDNLIKSDAMRIFSGQLERWEYTALDDAAAVANAIRRAMSIKGQE